ncbi:uncharacterized protein M421DRAFT_4008 [Didymella exigua CBS 183.55]|uniref:Uncharacterized protein n=1 Tax=Didymella exigua CBS 183.55 TaxID=1150837 RepID=A0A6A5RQU9_9PLEO|nr:uncharacterized protein M421DRAFT_4008 [Didymella exigua CBS 183.55]KAF1929538.1 hypothetical protein M421DRAFT_4008 [Didymella exigua CBS 183.55]
MPAPLLALPRELRDQIYALLWSSTPTITLQNHPSMGQIHATYASLSGLATHLPPWLLTSKQILLEATDQMIRHGTWTLRLRSEWDTEHAGRVLSPLLARRVTIVLTQPLEGPRPRWPHVVRETVLRPSRENGACFEGVVEQLRTERVRDVRIVLELVREEAGARLDLSMLEAACALRPGLERLEVVVLREQVYRMYTEGFVEAIGAEVKRVGNKIMGSDEDPTVSGIFQDKGFVYTFDQAGEMGLCRVDSAVGEADH